MRGVAQLVNAHQMLDSHQMLIVQAMIAPNIEAHQLVADCTMDQRSKDIGFMFGQKLSLKRRITVEFKSKNKSGEVVAKRVDVGTNDLVFLSGMAKDMPIIRAQNEIDGAMQEALHAVSFDNLKEFNPVQAKGQGKGQTHAVEVPAAVDYVMQGERGKQTTEITIVKGCENNLSADSKVTRIQNACDRARLAMEIATLHAPRLTSADLAIVFAQ